jgi:hypothetical protein
MVVPRSLVCPSSRWVVATVESLRSCAVASGARLKWSRRLLAGRWIRCELVWHVLLLHLLLLLGLLLLLLHQGLLLLHLLHHG